MTKKQLNPHRFDPSPRLPEFKTFGQLPRKTQASFLVSCLKRGLVDSIHALHDDGARYYEAQVNTGTELNLTSGTASDPEGATFNVVRKLATYALSESSLVETARAVLKDAGLEVPKAKRRKIEQ